MQQLELPRSTTPGPTGVPKQSEEDPQSAALSVALIEQPTVVPQPSTKMFLQAH